MSGRMDGRRVVVIGAGSVGPGLGNGKAAAMLYAREGARVLAVDRSAEAAEETVRLIREEGGDALPFAGDMTEPAAARAAVAEAGRAFGGLDVLHFNIGTSTRAGVTETDPEDWARVFRVNLDAALHATQAALPALERSGRGAIVYIASVAALRGVGYPYAAYEASKAALLRFSKTVALEYAARGVRANTVVPGLIDTPHVAAHVARPDADLDALARDRAALAPMGRQGSAWDVAEAALFLASDAAGYVTGIDLIVDGGLSCAGPGAPAPAQDRSAKWLDGPTLGDVEAAKGLVRRFGKTP